MLLPLIVGGLLLLMGEGSTGAFADLLRRYLAHDDAIKQMVINVSLSVVVLAIASSIVLSLIFPKSENATAGGVDAPDSDDEPGIL
jgi:hypothetical protein